MKLHDLQCEGCFSKQIRLILGIEPAHGETQVCIEYYTVPAAVIISHRRLVDLCEQVVDSRFLGQAVLSASLVSIPYQFFLDASSAYKDSI